MTMRLVTKAPRRRFSGLAAAAVLGTLTLGVPSVALATGEPMDAAEIRQMIAGKRIYLATPLGGELPLHYRANGVVDGSGEAIGLGRYLKPKDKGRWWVTNDKLCQKWAEWYDGRTFCFKLNKISGSKVFWLRDDGTSGVARVGR